MFPGVEHHVLSGNAIDFGEQLLLDSSPGSDGDAGAFVLVAEDFRGRNIAVVQTSSSIG